MNRREFFWVVTAGLAVAVLPTSKKTLSANDVSYIMDYPIISQRDGWCFYYTEISQNYMEIRAKKNNESDIVSNFDTGSLQDYICARKRIVSQIDIDYDR